MPTDQSDLIQDENVSLIDARTETLGVQHDITFRVASDAVYGLWFVQVDAGHLIVRLDGYKRRVKKWMCSSACMLGTGGASERHFQADDRNKDNRISKPSLSLYRRIQQQPVWERDAGCMTVNDKDNNGDDPT